MIILRVASVTAALLLCATVPVAAAVIEAQYRMPTEQPAPVTPKPAAEPKTSADRDSRVKERTPPPRPIVPPEGQQQNPALREDCAWIGQRIVSLLVRDDPMTGNDFVPFYQRFGCPPEHLSKAFGCVVAAGSGENDVLAERVAQCWTDPERRPAPVEAEKKTEEPAPPANKPSNGAK
ncbi:MAG: hypothetical protein U1E33_07135 [Rhodospirillales bacterium]